MSLITLPAYSCLPSLLLSVKSVRCRYKWKIFSLIFWIFCISSSKKFFISDSTTLFCLSFSFCCFWSLKCCNWFSHLYLAHLTCSNILLEMSLEWGDSLCERRWSLIKRWDRIINSSTFWARGSLFKLKPLSMEAFPWLIVKMSCKIIQIITEMNGC